MHISALLDIFASTPVQDYFTKYGYIGIFVWFVTIDQIGPLPEEVSLIIIGYFAGKGLINPFGAGIAALAAFLAVDIAYFLLTKSGGRLFNKFIGKKLQSRVALRVKERLKRNMLGTLIIFSFIPRLRLLAPVLAALIPIRLAKFAAYDAISSTLFTGIFVSIGVIFHKSISTLLGKIQSYEDYIFIGAIVLMIGLSVFVVKKLK